MIPSLIDNYVFLVWDPESREAGVLDPAEGNTLSDKHLSPTNQKIIDFITTNHLSLKWIFNTHHHYDHVGGIAELHSLYTAQAGRRLPVYHSIKNQYFQSPSPLWQDALPVHQGEVISLGKKKLEVLEYPGHTLDHLALHHENLLFCGDTLFSLGCGRIFDGSASLLFKSLERIKNLPKDTLIYCSHEFTLKNAEFCLQYDPKNQDLLAQIQDANNKRKNNLPTIPSPLSLELKTNIFLRCHLPQLRIALGVDPCCSDEEVFTELRKRKNSF